MFEFNVRLFVRGWVSPICKGTCRRTITTCIYILRSKCSIFPIKLFCDDDLLVFEIVEPIIFQFLVILRSS